MTTQNQLPPIERWWPELSITAKHSLQVDLESEVSDVVLQEIDTLLACKVSGSHHFLTDSERAFIRTQGEIVD